VKRNLPIFFVDQIAKLAYKVARMALSKSKKAIIRRST
jgi:hypothetical protein